jgi:CheY-like chemotaxis protein
MIRILIVEDQPAQREHLTRVFKRNSFEVFEAGDGVEGVERACFRKPDLVLMDLRMPRMDGIEAIKLLRKTPKSSDLPIIVVTAWHSERIRTRACRAGANLYLTKPVDPATLMREVTKLVTVTRARPSHTSECTPAT